MKPNSNPSISDELCWDFFVGGDFVLSIFRMEEQWYNLVSTEQPSDVYKRQIGSRTERLNGHIGTETRPRLLREAAVGNIAQWGKP